MLVGIGALAGLCALNGANGATGASSSPDPAACARFLRSLYEPKMGMLVEYPGSKTIWLTHDNLLAERALRKRDPELATKIKRAMEPCGRAPAGKLAVILADKPKPITLVDPALVEVSRSGEWTVKTEEDTERKTMGWESYADLLLITAMGEAKAHPEASRMHFDDAMKLWDGIGFMDAATKDSKTYASFKLALALLAAKRLHRSVTDKRRMLDILKRMQNAEGGIITDYDSRLQRKGLPNAETTSFVLIALDEISQRSPK